MFQSGKGKQIEKLIHLSLKKKGKTDCEARQDSFDRTTELGKLLKDSFTLSPVTVALFFQTLESLILLEFRLDLKDLKGKRKN